MTAAAIIEKMLNEEGFSTKKAFRRLPRKQKLPSMAEVDFYLSYAPEDLRPDFDDEANEWIYDQLNLGNAWAWCRVELSASWTSEDGTEFIATDHLGGCSYRSREDFIENSGYYDDMKNQAYDDLIKDIEAYRAI